MAKAMDFVRFATALAPAVQGLLRTLYERNHGDVKAAQQEISAIRNHGAELEAWKQEIRERLDAAKARERAKEPPK
jgi:hypothetical protein